MDAAKIRQFFCLARNIWQCFVVSVYVLPSKCRELLLLVGIFFDLYQFVHISDKVHKRDIGFCPYHAYAIDNQIPHYLFHEPYTCSIW